MGAEFYQNTYLISDENYWRIRGDSAPALASGHRYAEEVKLCVCCTRSLKGRQSKFCSRKCKNRYTNNKHQSYVAQQARGRGRKIALVDLKGGCCEKCGYCRNYAALEFHHSDPAMKLFNLDLRVLSNRKWSTLIEEAAKCRLLCSNCHKETHNPDSSLDCEQKKPGIARLSR